MNHFVENILKHYIRESQQGYGSTIFGVILLIAAILLFKFAAPLSLLKGLAIPSFLIGLIMGLGGVTDGHFARKSITEQISLYENNREAFFNQEVPKVEKIHKSWKDIRIIWSVITLTGITLLFAAKKDYLKGVALGTIILSLAGHTEEAISKNFNEKYYKEVLEEAVKNDSVSLNNGTHSSNNSSFDTTNNQLHSEQNDKPKKHHQHKKEMPKTFLNNKFYNQ
ncbi:hypothetical protein A9P82_09175 [Arachidicoccus ginsenosidimutans]|uniref:hypothetical protein n=1 Tax=Arachidicoccus sp. BS20 TaxID=1850526 RepID=UPI0007F177B1|nr:hypothetical protein [Arachidicoccus sp. BS20]ANI89451.1 hypothetical protein A9P82_09175 [Arachidicoccus sp. BS20]